MKNPQLKRANATDEYTPAMVAELLKCQKDPVYFMRNYVKIQHPKRGTINFELFEYQERFVRHMQENRFTVTLQPRQCGKTLTAAMYLLWFALFHPDMTVLIASKNQSHALEIAGRVRFAYEELPNWLKAGLKYYNRHNIEFDNGSRIISEATTEKTGRGLSISKLYLDELAFISPRIQELLWASLAPTLSTGGSAIISSTPNGDTELFAQLWRRAMSGSASDSDNISFVPFQVHWREHPERDEKYWEMMVNMLGLLKTRQEVGCILGDTNITTRNKITGEIACGTIEDVAKELLAHVQDTLPDDLDSRERQDPSRQRRAFVRGSSQERQPRGQSTREPRVHPSTAALRAALGAWGSVRSDADRTSSREDTRGTQRDPAGREAIRSNSQEDLGDQASTVRSWIGTLVQEQETLGTDARRLERSTAWETTLIEALARTSSGDSSDSRTTTGARGTPRVVRVGAGETHPGNEVPVVLSTEHLQDSEREQLVLLIPNRTLEILTPSGFQEFSGIRVQKKDRTLLIKTGRTSVECSIDHRFGNDLASELNIGDSVPAISQEQVLALEERGAALVYDPVDVQGGHQYLSNGLISHNCEFLSSDALLISSMKLQQITHKEPIYEDMGFKFWVKEEELCGPGKTYLVSLDPATGNGRDFSVIEVFNFPQLQQVAEWRSNEINIPLLYAKIKWILNKLAEPVGRGRADVLWTFERNGIGEAVSALYYNDEKQPEHPELYCDMPGKLGVYTSGKTKILACLQLKQLVEKVSNGFKLASETLLFELKNFVAKGGTYEAKSGATDDCVMAIVGITRLIKRLAEYNDEAFKQVNEYIDPNGTDVENDTDSFDGEPVPFAIV